MSLLRGSQPGVLLNTSPCWPSAATAACGNRCTNAWGYAGDGSASGVVTSRYPAVNAEFCTACGDVDAGSAVVDGTGNQNS